MKPPVKKPEDNASIGPSRVGRLRLPPLFDMYDRRKRNVDGGVLAGSLLAEKLELTCETLAVYGTPDASCYHASDIGVFDLVYMSVSFVATPDQSHTT